MGAPAQRGQPQASVVARGGPGALSLPGGVGGSPCPSDSLRHPAAALPKTAGAWERGVGMGSDTGRAWAWLWYGRGHGYGVGMGLGTGVDVSPGAGNAGDAARGPQPPGRTQSGREVRDGGQQPWQGSS